jgi:AraC family transcriptional regulator
VVQLWRIHAALADCTGHDRLYESDYQIDHGRWEGSEGELITMLLPASLIEGLQRDEAPRLQLRTRHEHFDERVRGLMERLWEEARTGSPSGRLYTDGLTLALVGLLTAEPPPSNNRRPWRARQLSVGEQVRLRAFIGAELGSDLSIERIASVAGMSPDHFARLFKSSFGCTPHAFVLERRIDAAARALRSDPDRSLADIAANCGFSSQSHFTAVFQRRKGTTPRRWRLEA